MNPRSLLSVLLTIAFVSFAGGSTSETNLEQLPETLNKTRELIGYVKDQRLRQQKDPQNTRGPLVQNVVESEAVDYIQKNPEAVHKATEDLYNEIKSQQLNSDPTKHVRLIPPQGQPGYQDLKFFASDACRIGRKKIPASHLVQVWREFLRQAQKEIILNVYEFDLEEVAFDLIAAAGRGVSVQVGIDADVINAKPNIKAIFEKLKSGGVRVVAVNAVGINHQKIAAIDWSDISLARALFSSGNLTQSCLGPEGDLKNVSPRPAQSIPNANHVITMKSWLAANLIHHELSKTFSPELGLRGALYPITGSYQMTGPNTDPYTLEAYPEGSFILSFTPGGGYRSINKNILARLIEKSEGPIRLVQFAYSAQAVSEALLKKAVRDYTTTGKFDFLSVGDTPFAMQEWSQFLKMSGLKRTQDVVSVTAPNGEKRERKISRFLEDETNPWKQSLSAHQIRDLRRHVRVAPAVYGNSTVLVAQKRYDVSAKIHHKLMAVGEFAVAGTSFNFSEGAESNNEQILVFREPKLVQAVKGIAEELAKYSPSSVYEEALKRNERVRRGQDTADDSTKIEDATELVP